MHQNGEREKYEWQDEETMRLQQPRTRQQVEDLLRHEQVAKAERAAALGRVREFLSTQVPAPTLDGALLAQLREGMGFSVGDLSELLAVDPTTVERAEQNLDVSVFEKPLKQFVAAARAIAEAESA